MCRSILLVGVAVASLAAGCAAVPESDTSARIAAAPAPIAPDENVEPELVMDAEDVRPGSRVRCRDMLQFGSNVIVTRCMSLDAWKRYEQMETERAQRIVRAMQGSAYANW